MIPDDHSVGTPPPSPLDFAGNVLTVGTRVVIQTVESCAHDLPEDDQLRLRALVGKVRSILEIDQFGFIWFDSEDSEVSASFCQQPVEVLLFER